MPAKAEFTEFICPLLRIREEADFYESEVRFVNVLCILKFFWLKIRQQLIEIFTYANYKYYNTKMILILDDIFDAHVDR